jgi:hypothetical protein
MTSRLKRLPRWLFKLEDDGQNNLVSMSLLTGSMFFSSDVATGFSL